MIAAARGPHVVSVFPGFGVGGAQVRFATVANGLGAAVRHSVVSLNGDLACREKLDPSLDVRFPAFGQQAGGHRAGGKQAGRMVAAARHASRFLREAAPDLVLTSNWGSIEWAMGAKLARLRHAHTEDGFGPEEQSAQIPRRVLTRRLVLRRSQVVLPSQRLMIIAADVWKLPARQLRYVPNGIDLARFHRATPMPLLAAEGPVIGTVAALRPEKNTGRLLRAFAILRAQRPARLLIVGDGPERGSLHALAQTLGIGADTLFAGHTAEAERWLAAMDVFALSSDTEQMPISLLEAMASGLPAVCTRVGDVGRMVAEANRPFVTALSVEAMADGLSRVLDADRRAIGAANRLRVAREYDQAKMVAEYANLFGLNS